MSKRRRTTPLVRTARRPIDKELKVVFKNMSAAQQQTILKTATFPCTLTGLRWDISANSILVSSPVTIHWCIVVVHDGNSANAMAISDAADFYTPEQDVLTFGITRLADADLGNGPSTTHWSGSTKTMRKLKQGDQLICLVQSTTAAVGAFIGIIQFFCKS